MRSLRWLVILSITLATASAQHNLGQKAVTNRTVSTLTGALEHDGKYVAIRTESGRVPINFGRLQHSAILQDALARGARVEVIGRPAERKGTVMFLAEELRIDGRVLKIRNQNGIVLPRREVR